MAPIPGTRTISSDFRLIAATNRDLAGEVAAGRFREDLYYRLNVVKAAMPPLRERREDIPLLIKHFMDKYRQETPTPHSVKGITQEAVQLLCEHDWKGNVRELENVIERAVILANSELVSLADLPAQLRQSS